MPALLLSDRQVIRLSGPEAEAFLQNLITTDLPSLDEATARAGALLTPQGKVMFDFLVARDGAGGFFVETRRQVCGDLVKRLTLYRLRAKVDIETCDDLDVTVAWDEACEGWLQDARFRGNTPVYRRYALHVDAGPASMDAYDRLRIENSVAESPNDFALSEAFPHDILFDLNEGVSFRKGCFVGQEVVSRMQHRGTARRRIMMAEASGDLPATGSPVSAGGKAIGTLGTAVGAKGLALVRTDRVADAAASGTAIEADGVALTLSFAPWSGLALRQPEEASPE